MLDLQYMILLSKTGKVRCIRWFAEYTSREKQVLLKDVISLVLTRKAKESNIIEYDMKSVSNTKSLNGHRVMYKRYASLYFVAGIDDSDSCNELLILESIHRFVETLDKYFGNVCELDIIYNFQKCYYIMLETFSSDGNLLESSKKKILHDIQLMDQLENNDSINNILS
ncbi:Adaptor protein complex sigma subunit [Hanseniaspora valbyensis NRRL Y-1626]|uniref:AP complex subunit sigma n=1 Tax=Hanseniaspora valbyensis NRRL Y-1626 TaxID=766949 RepID=A0A1B7TK75_9ASCO|nr:Adaptor protein complex sigma subunit [Hanseniaspora valbyensis NRRL Y-1626]